MMVFRNTYDADGLPICPRCENVVRSGQPAARSDDAITHLRCLWPERSSVLSPDDDAVEADRQMGIFIRAIKKVLQRIGAVRAAA